MRLRQKIAMALCAFYLISVIGIAMNMHYCGGRLSSVGFAKTSKCGGCNGDDKIESAHSCCKTTSIIAKVKDSHEAGFKVKLPQNFSFELFTGHVISQPLKSFLSSLLSKAENKAPPLSAIISLHLYHCIFRN